MSIEYLEFEDVVNLHDQALEAYGGISGVHSEKLEAKLALPMSEFGSYDRYPTIAEKAAVYLYELASAHCFMDGNKRTAYISAFVFLDINGYDLVASDEEIFNFILSVADSDTRPALEEVVGWIEAHMNLQEE